MEGTEVVHSEARACAPRIHPSSRAAQAKQEQREKHQQVAAYKLAKDQDQQQQRQLQQALEKPKAVISHAEGEARVQRDLQTARHRHDKLDAHRNQRAERAEWLKLAAKRTPAVQSDTERVLKATKSSQSRGFTPEQVDERDSNREELGAHERPMARAAADLKYHGRAPVAWRKGLT